MLDAEIDIFNQLKEYGCTPDLFAYTQLAWDLKNAHKLQDVFFRSSITLGHLGNEGTD